ncbi:hypothetical protein [Moraxella catarrhalis]|nr:hypothetical protein [Moraxella catarrhalis]
MMICIAISVKIQGMTVFSHSMGGRLGNLMHGGDPTVADTTKTVSSASIS